MTNTLIPPPSVSWGEKAFWAERAPTLHLNDKAFIDAHPSMGVDAHAMEQLRSLIRSEGYFQLDPQTWNLPLPDMVATVSSLVSQDIPTPFAFVYDEFWLLYRKLNRLIEALLGPGFYRLPDFWVWHVDPQKDQSGWKPHRDKGHRSLRPDGMPNAVTVWIPLSDSTTLNGCMYIVPADRDPTYGTAQDREWKFSYADIRALPALAGSVFCWNQAVLHWGSHSSPRYPRPRVSAAFEFQASDIPPYNQPIMNPDDLPTHEFRLALVAKQILQYQHMAALASHIRSQVEGLFAVYGEQLRKGV